MLLLPVLASASPWDAVPLVPALAAVRLPAAIALVLLAVTALALRRGVIAVVAGLAVVATVVATVAGPGRAPSPGRPWTPVASTTEAADDALSVLAVNARLGGVDAEQIVTTVEWAGVDVLAVVELTPALVARLRDAGLENHLPHHHLADEPGASGAGLWSAVPLDATGTAEGTAWPQPWAELAHGGCTVRVTAVHARPPLPGGEQGWADDLDALGAHLRARPGVVEIAAGDFNAADVHASYRRLLGDELVDAARSWTPTWPQTGGPAWIDLDHVIVSRGTDVLDARTDHVDGTDHRSVRADLAPSC